MTAPLFFLESLSFYSRCGIWGEFYSDPAGDLSFYAVCFIKFIMFVNSSSSSLFAKFLVGFSLEVGYIIKMYRFALFFWGTLILLFLHILVKSLYLSFYFEFFNWTSVDSYRLFFLSIASFNIILNPLLNHYSSEFGF